MTSKVVEDLDFANCYNDLVRFPFLHNLEKHLGIAERTIRRRATEMRRRRERGESVPSLISRRSKGAEFEENGSIPKPVAPGFTIRRNSVELDEEGQVKKQWVSTAPEPGDEFELPAGHTIKGVSALMDANGRVMQTWVKTRTDTTTQDFIEAIRRTFADYHGFAPLMPAPQSTDDALLSVYPIADQHNGLRAWGRESGEDYSLKTGAERLRETMRRLISMSPPSKEALILNLGDWTHADDSRNMTPRSGHILDVDGRYFEIMTAGVRLMMDVIELALQKHETVLVRNLPGNHDPHAAFALTIALSAFYAGNPRVTIDDDPSELFFYRFGQTLIGANHGHRMKPSDMAMTMAVRRRKDWGETLFHWFLFGHIHHETAREVGDVRCESFQTLAAKDAYSANGGYNSGNSLTSVTLHRELGEIGRHRVNVAAPRTMS